MMRQIIFSILLSLTLNGAIGQQTAFIKNGPASHLKELSKVYYKEKIFLHVNSAFMLTGESVLFKAYCLSDTDQSLSGLSSIAYVDLVGPGGIPVLRSRINLKNGLGAGDFFLPSSLVSGNYTLVAYTHWMRNDAHADFFRKQITIINPFRKPQPTASVKNKLEVNFYPEGGKLLAGIENIVGFASATPARFSGKLMDATGTTVAEFTSSQNGTGRFKFMPRAGQEYKALILDSLQQAIFKTLPSPRSEGVSIQVDDTVDEYHVTVNDLLPGKDRHILVVHHRAIPLFESELRFTDQKAEVRFNKSILPPGISQISVFNSTNEIEAARLIAKRNLKEGKLTLEASKTQLGTRELVSLKLRMEDTIQVANVSVSVRQLDPVINKSIDATNALSGYSTTVTSAMLEDFALARPADRYNFDGGLPVRFMPELRGSLITGIVVDSMQSPKAKTIVFLSVPAKNYIFYAARTDSMGRFYFNTEKIPPASELIFSTDPGKCRGCLVTVDQDELSNLADFAPVDLVVDSALRKVIERRSILAQIENAYYVQKQDSILPGTTEPFYGKADKSYNLDDFVRFPSMEDIFIEYLVEVILKKKNDKYDVKAMNFVTRQAFEGEPLILLDGVPLFNTEQIMGYNPLSLQKIEVVGRKYFYGPLESDGIISMSTYNGDVKNISLPERVKFIGVQPAKKYYTPDYSSAKLEKIPDYRIQLYWNPDMKITDRSFSAQFYTSDVAGDFEIVVTGIQSDGTPIYIRQIIHVDEK